MSKSAAVKAISIILRGYPTTDSADREAFMELAVRALADYPDELLGYLADPARGIVRKSEFIPTVAKMCAHMDAEWDRQRAKQNFMDREAARKLAPPDGPAVSPETRERVKGLFAKLSQDLRPARGAHGERRLRTNAEIRDMAEAALDAERQRIKAEGLPKLSAKAIARITANETRKERKWLIYQKLRLGIR